MHQCRAKPGWPGTKGARGLVPGPLGEPVGMHGTARKAIVPGQARPVKNGPRPARARAGPGGPNGQLQLAEWQMNNNEPRAASPAQAISRVAGQVACDQEGQATIYAQHLEAPPIIALQDSSNVLRSSRFLQQSDGDTTGVLWALGTPLSHLCSCSNLSAISRLES